MLRNLLLLSVTFLCMLFVAELLVRFFQPYYIPSHVFYENSLLAKDAGVRVDGYALVETNSFRHVSPSGEYDVIYNYNRYGLRDSNDIASADSDSLLAVGDSYTFGHGMREEDRFSSLVARQTGMSVYNASVPTDLDGYRRLVDYANSIKETPFKRLLIGVTMENDIFSERMVVPEGAPVLYALKNFLATHSALYIFARFTIASNPLIASLMEPMEQSESLDMDEFQVSVDKVVSLAALASTTVLIIPSRFLWIGKPAEQLNTSRLHEKFVAALKQRGVDIVDMREYFEQDSTPLEFYLDADGHWNVAGHALAADVLSKHLLAKY